MALVSRRWNGLTLSERIHRAGGRAIVGIAVNVAIDTKRVTHVVSGTLVKSTHASPLGSYHDDDERLAQSADLLLSSGSLVSTPTPYGPAIEVGSWLPYACVEWVGRMHPGLEQGMEMNRGMRSDMVVKQAFREEGLV